MKSLIALAALLLSATLYAQPKQASNAIEEESTHKRKPRLHDQEFDRVDYYYKNNLLQTSIQHNAGGGYARTWNYYYPSEGASTAVLKLQEMYPHKQLHGATRVAFRNTVKYEVVMQDKNRWYVYQTDSLGNILMQKKFRKR